MNVTSVWSAHGHTFISTDCAEHESCLTCGAMYELRDLGDGSGEYVNARGDAPQSCTGDTSMAHGYPGERDDANGQHNVDHNCCCLLCA